MLLTSLVPRACAQINSVLTNDVGLRLRLVPAEGAEQPAAAAQRRAHAAARRRLRRLPVRTHVKDQERLGCFLLGAPPERLKQVRRAGIVLHRHCEVLDGGQITELSSSLATSEAAPTWL